MAPSKRRKTSAASEPTSGNTSAGVRTRRSAGTRGDLPDAPDADLADLEKQEEEGLGLGLGLGLGFRV